MQNTRTLPVTESTKPQPKITLTGPWLHDFGFSIGDTVTITCTEPGILIVQLSLSAPEMGHIIQGWKQELEISSASSGLQYEANLKAVHEHQVTMTQSPSLHYNHNEQ